MASKKYSLILGLISLFSSAAYSQQNDAGYDWRDSSKIATKNLPRQSEFMNNQYPYPAKPRNMWELGISAGNANVWGDIHAEAGLGGSVSLRKAVSHTFSLRAGYYGSLNNGNPTAAREAAGQRDYHSWTHMAGLDLIASLNPASHYRGNPKTNIYVLAGANLIASKVFFRQAGGAQYNGQYSTYYGFPRAGYAGSGENGLIRTFGGAEVNNRKGYALLSGVSGGGGIAFKISPKVNIGLEERLTFTAYDALDGFKAGRSQDIMTYTSARLNINLGSSSKRVQPLWWLNPNNFIYNELNRPQHMLLPTPVLPDADGDGVTDQFDMEPNTPKGAPVDVRGVAKDSDGDGVPDYKDKELLTSQKCFPVDADGVGTCPEPACCKELRDLIAAGGGTGGTCNIGNLPTVQFRSGSATLSRDAQTMLTTVASQIKQNATCKVKVTGHGASTKAEQQMSWDRVNAVIRYLVEKQGIAEDRFVFFYGTEGDANTVDLTGTTEEGPNTVPAPHPNLKKG